MQMRSKYQEMVALLLYSTSHVRKDWNKKLEGFRDFLVNSLFGYFFIFFQFLPTNPSFHLIPKLIENVKDIIWNYSNTDFQLMLVCWVCWALYQLRKKKIIASGQKGSQIQIMCREQHYKAMDMYNKNDLLYTFLLNIFPQIFTAFIVQFYFSAQKHSHKQPLSALENSLAVGRYPICEASL